MSMKHKFITTPRRIMDKIFDVRTGWWSPNVNYQNRILVKQFQIKNMSPPPVNDAIRYALNVAVAS